MPSRKHYNIALEFRIQKILARGERIDKDTRRQMAVDYASSLEDVNRIVARMSLSKATIIRRRVKRQNQRAMAKNVQGQVTYDEWIKILTRHDYKCALCKKDCDPDMDHIIPISKGGTHTANNVQPLCVNCNSRKGDKIHYIP